MANLPISGLPIGTPNLSDIVPFSQSGITKQFTITGLPFVKITGSTMTGQLTVPILSATTITGTTYYGDGQNLTGIVAILFFGHDSINPGDGITYYIGNSVNQAPITSSSDGRRVMSPENGRITSISISFTVGGTLGTSEASTFVINNVTTAVSSTFSNTTTYDSSSGLFNYDLVSPLSVSKNDKLEINWTTPAWVTNPTAIRQQFNVTITT